MDPYRVLEELKMSNVTQEVADLKMAKYLIVGAVALAVIASGTCVTTSIHGDSAKVEQDRLEAEKAQHEEAREMWKKMPAPVAPKE